MTQKIEKMALTQQRRVPQLRDTVRDLHVKPWQDWLQDTCSNAGHPYIIQIGSVANFSLRPPVWQTCSAMRGSPRAGHVLQQSGRRILPGLDCRLFGSPAPVDDLDAPIKQGVRPQYGSAPAPLRKRQRRVAAAELCECMAGDRRRDVVDGTALWLMRQGIET